MSPSVFRCLPLSFIEVPDRNPEVQTIRSIYPFIIDALEHALKITMGNDNC